MPYPFPEFRTRVADVEGALPALGRVEELTALRNALQRIGVLTPEHISIAVAHLHVEERARLVALRNHAAPLAAQLAPLNEYLGLIATGHDRALSAIASIEKRRAPLENEPQRIGLDDLVVWAKVSKLDWDMRMLGIDSRDALLSRYAREGSDAASIVEGHEAHNRAVAEMKELVGAERVKSYWEWANGRQPTKSLVILLGGDDTFKAGSHPIRNEFVLGINSDVSNSVGAHLRLHMGQVADALGRLERGDFQIEEWTRLSVAINGQPPVLALDELFIGENEAKYTSRAAIEQSGEEIVRAKGSGIVIATGSGSTGWLRAATRRLYSGKNIWPRTAPHAEFSIREPYENQGALLDNGALGPGEELTIRSSHSKNGVISPDCVYDVPFPRGNVARVSLGTPLKVITF